MDIEHIIWEIPGFCAIKGLDHSYKAISKQASELLFGREQKTNGFFDYDIPGTVSRLSNIFINNDKNIIENNIQLKTLDIGIWSDKFGGAILTEKKIFHAANNKEGVIFQSVSLDCKVLQALRAVVNNDLSKKINGENTGSYTIDSDIYDLSAKAKECLFFIGYGFSNRKISELINRSNRTVEKYIEELKNVFGVDKKSEILDSAILSGHAFNIPDSILKKYLSIHI